MTTQFSRAQDVAQELYTRLTAVSVANGYETDIGLKVFRGRRNIDEGSPPCSSLIEGEDTSIDRAGRTPTCLISQRYVFVAYVPCTADNPNDAAHAAIRDMKRAIFGKDGRLDGKVHKVTYRGRDIGPRADGVNIVMAVVEIEVEYVENLAEP